MRIRNENNDIALIFTEEEARFHCELCGKIEDFLNKGGGRSPEADFIGEIYLLLKSSYTSGDKTLSELVSDIKHPSSSLGRK